jgi:phosphohistidine phosphatase
MRTIGAQFDFIVSSPLVRAIQTAEVVMKEMVIPREALVVTESLAPGGSRAALVREINRLAERAGSIVLVGHEPGLSELIGLFCSGRDDASIELKKGGFAKLETARLRTGRCATLEWLLTPKQLRAFT